MNEFIVHAGFKISVRDTFEVNQRLLRSLWVHIVLINSSFSPQIHQMKRYPPAYLTFPFGRLRGITGLMCLKRNPHSFFTTKPDPLLMFSLSLHVIGQKSPFSLEHPFSTQHQVRVIFTSQIYLESADFSPFT